jgi:hypothetical protein
MPAATFSGVKRSVAKQLKAQKETVRYAKVFILGDGIDML